MPPAVLAPPHTQAEPVTETLHGVEVTDPYRWLEDQNSPRTRAWIEEQTAYTRAYLEAIPGREQIRARVKELLAVKEVISEPWNVGERYFFLKRQNKAEQPVIVTRDGLFGPETVLVDPALRATGATTSVLLPRSPRMVDSLRIPFDKAERTIQRWKFWIFNERSSLQTVCQKDSATGLAFTPDGTGFYYSHRELDDARPHYRAVVWHGLGADRLQDKEIFFAGEKSNLFVGVLCSSEANLLAFPVFSNGKFRRTSLYLQKIGNASDHPKPLLKDIQGCFVPFFVGCQLFAYTDYAAPNFRVVRIDLVSPDPACWRDVVPETNQRIQQFSVAGDQIFVTRIERFETSIEVFRLHGEGKGEIVFSALGSIDLLNSTMKSDKVFYSQTSIQHPPSIRCYDTRQKKLYTCDESDLPFDGHEIEVEECAYPSGDKTMVPLLLAARKDRLHSGPLPTFLSGYGGFGSCVTPRFTAFATFLMEHGFLFAVPALRGGSELGETWHRAAMRENRQNAFDDFTAAAEWLIVEGHAVPGRIAIGGGSNAGLLVGAAITRRPDLFRAAICLGPLLDMTRYHLFNFAAVWSEEYGSPEDEGDFHYILGYSPYHHVRDGADYPAVLLISGDADTRCNPMHARKMAARMQAATRSAHPILLDYKSAWGHSPVQPFSIKIEALTERLAFVCHELGVHFKPKGLL